MPFVSYGRFMTHSLLFQFKRMSVAVGVKLLRSSEAQQDDCRWNPAHKMYVDTYSLHKCKKNIYIYIYIFSDYYYVELVQDKSH